MTTSLFVGDLSSKPLTWPTGQPFAYTDKHEGLFLHCLSQ